MKSLYDFVVKPRGQRYNNTKQIEDKELILNTEIFNHKFVNNVATIVSVPLLIETDLQPGDDVVIHHNVFRRWHDMHGVEKNSRSYFDEETYLITQDQMYLWKRYWDWKPLKGYCFVKPVKSKDKLNLDKEAPLIGIVAFGNESVKKGDLVGFKPSSEFEFIVNGEKLYRVLSQSITIKYEYQGDEKKYNPSWT